MNKHFPGHRPIAFVLFGFGWFFFVFSAYILLSVLFKHNYLSMLYEDHTDLGEQAPVILSGFIFWAAMMRLTTILGTSLQLEDHQILVKSWYGRTERITNPIQGVDYNASITKAILGFNFNVSLSFMPEIIRAHFDVPTVMDNIIRIKTSNREYYITVDNKATKDELFALLSASVTGKGSLQ